MGFLNLFKHGKNGFAAAPPPLPTGSFTVDRDGQILTSTVSSTTSPASLEQISRQILQTFRDAKETNLNLSEFKIAMGAMNIKARELRGGAIIFLSPCSDLKK
jgi:hypothetical protein